jgi:hypothetical protein
VRSVRGVRSGYAPSCCFELEALSKRGQRLAVAEALSQPVALERLYDDPRAQSVLSAASAGLSVSGGSGTFTLVGRFGDWKQGGEAPNPPPLTATRLLALQGLEPVQVAAIVELEASTMRVEQQRSTGETPASLLPALQRADLVLQDRRASLNCQAPCQPWPWQTIWSLFSAAARAQWRQGERYRDPALLAQGEANARRALGAIPSGTQPVTAAVTERLLGVLLQALAQQGGSDEVLAQSLAASERALAGFSGEEHRYDWALTQQNIVGALTTRFGRSTAPAAIEPALLASERVLSVLDQRTPNLRAQALLERARLLQSRWARSGRAADLTQSLQLVQEAAATPGASAETLAIAVAVARCEVESDASSRRWDTAGLKRAAAYCQPLLSRATLPEESEPELHRSLGLSLGRLAYATDDTALIEQAVTELERAIESADRIEGRRASVKAQADYAWALLVQSRMNMSGEPARKAASVLNEALELTSRQAAPLQWGQLKHHQGLALLDLGWKARAAFQMEEAIGLYQQARAAFTAALGTFAKDDNPRRWADLQQAVGKTFAREAESKPANKRDLILDAVAHYQRALAVLPRESEPAEHAEAQFGLGSAHLIASHARVKRAAKEAAKLALAAFQPALEIHQKLRNIKAAAHTKAHMADALAILNLGVPAHLCDAVELRIEAVSEYRNASGLWMPARLDLERLDRQYFSRERCPRLPASFWEQAPKPKSSEPAR